MSEMNPLEMAVLAKIFEGDNEALAAFRKQIEGADVTSRELTGSGFFTKFQVPESIPSAPVKAGKIQFGDVEAKIEGLKHGAGFLVYAKEGRLMMLEGYSFEEPWPEAITSFELRYSAPSRPGFIEGLVS